LTFSVSTVGTIGFWSEIGFEGWLKIDFYSVLDSFEKGFTEIGLLVFENIPVLGFEKIFGIDSGLGAVLVSSAGLLNMLFGTELSDSGYFEPNIDFGASVFTEGVADKGYPPKIEVFGWSIDALDPKIEFPVWYNEENGFILLVSSDFSSPFF